MFFASAYGQVSKQEVPPGKTLFVSSGVFFACQTGLSYAVGLPGGCQTLCCGGEGFVLKFTGPCSVYTVNKDRWAFMALLAPAASGGGGGAAAAADAGAGAAA